MESEYAGRDSSLPEVQEGFWERYESNFENQKLKDAFGLYTILVGTLGREPTLDEFNKFTDERGRA